MYSKKKDPTSLIENKEKDLYNYLSIEVSSGRHTLGESNFIFIDIYENATSFIIEAELPGMKVSEIEIYISDKELIISGTKEEKIEYSDNLNFLCMERSFGPFKRLIRIPSAINKHKAMASYNNGILTITIPKSIERRKKQIKVEIL